MGEVENLALSLHPLERRIFPHIKYITTVTELVKRTKLQEVEVVRAAQWLENKHLVKITKEIREKVNLGANGEKYLNEGLPEKRFLRAIIDEPKSLQEIKEAAKLDQNEVSVSLGLLKKKNLINVHHKIKITEKGKSFLQERKNESFLESLPKNTYELSREESAFFDDLKKRKHIVEIKKETTTTVTLTPKGKEVQTKGNNEELIEAVSPKLLSSREWRGKRFRRYDVNVQVPSIHPGKRHFVAQAIRYIKQVWLEMGFEEMKGPLLETSFWNFDALFTPQDHPARELQDTFFVKGQGSLPSSKILRAVKKAHENGGNTGSEGWGYSWSEHIARRLVLRTHTTGVSARTLTKVNTSELPLKFFSVGKVFRNEALDWKHSFEFNQVEGIVIDKHANFQHLLGYLKEYYQKLGFNKIRFRPHYFPYTEMSVEIDVFHPERKEWMELGGAGMFRPEVVIPLLGKDVPVLAWGQGMERSVMDYYAIKDLREMYGNDLKILRDKKAWLR